MKLLIIAALLPAALYATSLCNGPARTDGQCGPNVGGASCLDKQACCSRFGFCGVGPQWCNANSFCLPATVSNSSNSAQPVPTSMATRAPVKLPVPVTVTGPVLVRALSECGRGKRVVALTFDDGPQPGANPNLLAELKANNIKATFFSSPQANGPEQLPARCDLVKKILADGHQLEQHSMTHPHFPDLTPAQVGDEIQKAAKFLKSCGASPKIFRPPFGELTGSQTSRVLSEFSMPIALWNVDPRDYEGAGVDVNFQRVVSEFETMVGVGNSAIILLHELDEGTTSGLVTKLAQYFRGLDYKFVTLDQCIKSCQGPICRSNPNDFPDILDAAASLLL